MAEKLKCIIMELRPDKVSERDKRVYREPQVKQIMYAFARDLGIKWRADKLRKFIETAFDFD